MVKRKFRWILSVLWGIFIAVLSLIPGGPGNVQLFGIPHFDKIGHFGMYAIWAFLIYHAISASPGMSRKKSMWISFTFVALIGIAFEFGQDLLTTYRSFEVADMVANGLGSLIGAVAGRLFYLFRSQ